MNVPPSLFWRTSLESISFSYQSLIFLCCYALTCEANPASIFEALCAEFICDVLIGWSSQATASLEPSTFANWPQDHASMAHCAWDRSGPPKCLIAAYTLMNGFRRKVTALTNKLHTLHQTNHGKPLLQAWSSWVDVSWACRPHVHGYTVGVA